MGMILKGAIHRRDRDKIVAQTGWSCGIISAKWVGISDGGCLLDGSFG
jgi:hypothetical protein